MGMLVRFPGAARRRVSFNKAELRRILDVYTRRVASGEWRDYAIDHEAGMAVFSIFRHTSEAPLYRVAKLATRRENDPEYAVMSGKRQLKRSGDIDEALSVLEPRLKVVT